MDDGVTFFESECVVLAMSSVPLMMCVYLCVCFAFSCVCIHICGQERPGPWQATRGRGRESSQGVGICRDATPRGEDKHTSDRAVQVRKQTPCSTAGRFMSASQQKLTKLLPPSSLGYAEVWSKPTQAARVTPEGSNNIIQYEMVETCALGKQLL